MKVNINKRIIVLIIIIIVFIVLLCMSKLQTYIFKKIYRLDYKEYIYKYSLENDTDPLLIASIIKAESNFKISRKSKSGAIGLMQLMEETALEEANELGENISTTERLYNPEISIKIGTKYFSKLQKKYKNYLVALAAYNAGIGNVDSWIKDGIIKEDGSDIENIPFKETNNYIRKVERNYKIYKKLYK